MIIGVILVAVGIIALLMKLGVIAEMWGYVWPAVLIILGLWFLGFWRRKRRWWWCGCDSDEKRRHHRHGGDE